MELKPHEIKIVALADEVDATLTSLIEKLFEGKESPEERLVIHRVLVGVMEDNLSDLESVARDLMKQIKLPPDKVKFPLEAHSFDWFSQRH